MNSTFQDNQHDTCIGTSRQFLCKDSVAMKQVDTHSYPLYEASGWTLSPILSRFKSNGIVCRCSVSYFILSFRGIIPFHFVFHSHSCFALDTSIPQDNLRYMSLLTRNYNGVQLVHPLLHPPIVSCSTTFSRVHCKFLGVTCGSSYNENRKL